MIRTFTLLTLLVSAACGSFVETAPSTFQTGYYSITALRVDGNFEDRQELQLEGLLTPANISNWKVDSNNGCSYVMHLNVDLEGLIHETCSNGRWETFDVINVTLLTKQ